MLETMNTNISDIYLKINLQQTDLVSAVVNAIDANDVYYDVLTLNNFEVSLNLFVCILIYSTNNQVHYSRVGWPKLGMQSRLSFAKCNRESLERLCLHV